MPMYQLKRSPIIEARQLQLNNLEEISQWMGTHITIHNNVEQLLAIEYNNATFYAYIGDFVVHNKTSFEIITSKMFKQKYDFVGE